MKKTGTLILLTVPILIAAAALIGSNFGQSEWLGMSLETLDGGTASEMGTPSSAGHLLVADVQDPALASGVIVGDLLLGVNGRPVETMEGFVQISGNATSVRGPGGLLPDVILTVNRLGRIVTIRVPSAMVEAYVRR